MIYFSGDELVYGGYVDEMYSHKIWDQKLTVKSLVISISTDHYLEPCHQSLKIKNNKNLYFYF